MCFQVQLESQHKVSLELPPAIITDVPSTTKIFALIEKEESIYQNTLNDTYQDMGEKTFKGLRRALPLTRQKLDWDKVSVVVSFHAAQPERLSRCWDISLEPS
jgi:capping protein alpha